MSGWMFAAAVLFSFGFMAGSLMVWVVYVLPDRKLRRAVLRMIDLSDIELAFRMLEAPDERQRRLEAELLRLREKRSP